MTEWESPWLLLTDMATLSLADPKKAPGSLHRLLRCKRDASGSFLYLDFPNIHDNIRCPSIGG